MDTSRTNHHGTSHKPGARDRRGRTKKQFVRIRGERRVRWIHDPDDWSSVHRPREKVQLVCPDEGCSESMKATERTNPRTTRYLSDTGDAPCTHYLPVGGGGPMTEEHLWVQGALRKICEDLGFEAHLEVDYADVRVESTPPFALEVQRVSTNFRERRKQRADRGMETVWFLPETAQKSRKDPLFTQPCVRLVYFDRPGPGATKLTAADLLEAVWTGGGTDSVDLRAAVTLWTPSQDHLRFEKDRALPIKQFLQQILEGERRWYPATSLHGTPAPKGTWAGWVLEEDLAAVQKSRLEDRRRRAEALQAREREVAETRRREEALEAERAAEHGAESEEPARESLEVRSGSPLPIAEPSFAVQDRVAAEPVQAPSRAPEAPLWKRIWSALFG